MKSAGAKRVRLTGPARRDIEEILQRSQAEFDAQAKQRYRALFDQALRDLGADSTRPGVKRADDIRPGYMLYHLKWSRTAMTEPVKKPRHIIAFYVDSTDVIVVARVFHERQMLSKHLSDSGDG